MPSDEVFASRDRKLIEAVVAGPPEQRSKGDHFDLKLNYVRDGTPRHIWLYLPKNPLNPKGCLFRKAAQGAAAGDARHCGKLAPGERVLLLGADVGDKLRPLGVHDRTTGEPIISEQLFFNSVRGRRSEIIGIVTIFVAVMVGLFAHALWLAWLERQARP